MKPGKLKPVAIVMGSKTDYTVLKEAEMVLRDFKVPCIVQVVSAHRTPKQMNEFAKNASKSYSLIIAGAGGAAHLPGMIASQTTLPVIGVPVTVGKLKGLDALLSIVQMPAGIPVATVAIDAGQNAGLLAVRMLSSFDHRLMKLLEKHQLHLRKKVLKMNKQIAKKYL